jgi:serine/threonine protein kinase/Tol biopolymer transport system component
MPLTAGTLLGVYEILAPLGAGGMGEVYRAHDTKLGRTVALKILPDALASDPDRIARFDREAKVLASLHHPYIAVLFGAEQSESRHFLVMELVEGETLEDRLRASGALPIPDALPIARQIAEALEAAHEKGIVHRDLKPANVKLTPDDTVKVLDFGLAKALSIEDTRSDSGAAGLTHSPTLTFAGATQAGMILGTAPYMSPEQAKGRAADKRSDVWAFGCVLYEMLAGRRAFEGDDVSEVLASVIKGEPDWTALPSTVPSEIRALIQGCVKKDRKERIGDISTALFLLRQPAPAAPASPTPRASIWRRTAPVAFGIIVGALVAAALLWRPRADSRPVTRFAIPLGAQQTLPRKGVAMSPDGRQIAFAADGRLYVRSLSESEAKPVAGSDGAAYPEFSPDGQWLLAWTIADTALKKIPIGGGTPITICKVTPAPSGVSWNGDSIVFAVSGAGIMRVSANGGTPEAIVPASDRTLFHGPQELPGGVLLFTEAHRLSTDFPWDQAQIVIQPLKGGERKTIIDGGSDGRYLPTGHLLYAVSGTIFAVPFDVNKLTVTGSAVPIIEGVGRASSITGGSAQYATSDSGSMVFIPGPASLGRLDLILFDRKGGAEPLKLTGGTYAYPRVSPDGRRVALESRSDKDTNISIYELSGSSAVRRLTFGGNNRFPVWSADGRRVAFQSDRDGDASVFWQPVDGGSAERLTKADPGTAHVPESWSPKGDVFLFSMTKQNSVSLWTFDLRERKASPFSDVKSSTFLTDAVFSPDGRWVAYQVGESGDGEGMLYVQPFPPDGKKYQIARGGRPAWSRDGAELFFVPAPGQFRVVKVTTRPAFAFSNPETVPRGFGIADPVNPRPYDVMPDGRTVAVAAAAQAAGSTAGVQLQVVLNWFEELKTRAPAAK